MVENASEVIDIMLREARISDGALIPLKERYKKFLAKLRAKGYFRSCSLYS